MLALIVYASVGPVFTWTQCASAYAYDYAYVAIKCAGELATHAQVT